MDAVAAARGQGVGLVAVLWAVVLISIWAYCLADYARTPESQMRTYDRRTWLFILVVLNVVGGLLWLALGRPQRPSSRRR